MSEKIRSFVAVDTSEQVKTELSRLITELKARTNLNVRWVKPEQMHLTLTFLGAVSQDFIEQAKVQLQDVAKGFKSFPCQLENLGAFPSAQRARVIWTGLKKGKAELKQLQATVSAALAKIGYVPEKRPFSPHLTLGRLRDFAPAEFMLEIAFTSSVWEVKEVILYQSNLYPDGPVYIPLACFALI